MPARGPVGAAAILAWTHVIHMLNIQVGMNHTEARAALYSTRVEVKWINVFLLLFTAVCLYFAG